MWSWCSLLIANIWIFTSCTIAFQLTFTFTFMHLADTFIQSDLHCIQVTVSTFDQVLLSLGIEPMILALLTPCSTSWATGKPLFKLQTLRSFVKVFMMNKTCENNKRLSQSSFSAILQKPMHKSCWGFVEGTRVMLISTLAYKTKCHHCTSLSKNTLNVVFCRWLWCLCWDSSSSASPECLMREHRLSLF